MALKDSVFHYYQKLIALRKQYDIIVYSGDYELLLPDSEEIYSYVRTYEGQKLLVICNFTENEVLYEVPEDLQGRGGKVLISNYGRNEVQNFMELAPYESMAVLY